jgi:DNA-binding NarL/FixJ family response regulator
MDSSHVTSSPPIRILVVDDHPAVRQGLAYMLASEGLEVCAEAGGRGDALARVEESRPDLAIVDLSLEDEDGLALVADLRVRDVPVLVYSMHNDATRVGSAFAAGALGYVTKRELQAVLVQAIREVARGRRFASPIAAAALAESVAASPADDVVHKLSAHERKVYELLGRGQDTFDIAAALHVSNHTVESYYERIKLKMGLKGMYEVRRHAIDDLHKHTL